MTTAFQKAIRKNLRAAADPRVRQGHERYFKQAVRFLGVRAPEVHAAFRQSFPLLAGQDADAMVEQAFALLGSGYQEEKLVGVDLLSRIHRRLPADFLQQLQPVFDRSVHDWATCDALAGRVLRFLVRRDDRACRRVVSWSRARNPWRQRASAVAFVNEARHGRYNREILAVCENLAGNPDRFVQLGMGWVLRELFLADRRATIGFIGRHHAGISAEALRYAMEKMPAAVRRRLLAERAAVNGIKSGRGRCPGPTTRKAGSS